MQTFVSGGATYSFEGELTEATEVIVTRPGAEVTKVPFGRLVAMTNGAILEDAP